MTHSQTVQFGILCLQALDQEDALSPQGVSRHCGIPLPDCRRVLEAFESAGIVGQDAQGRFRLQCEISSLNAMEVLRALWNAPVRPAAFRLLYASDRRTGPRSCREAAARWQAIGACPSDGGAF
jgi:DNA-binding IclR family transcriptional regulator